MDLRLVVLAVQILLARSTAGQKVTFLYNESVYTIPHFPQTYDNATDSCSNNHDGELEYISDPSQRVLALGFKDFQATGKIWTTDNLDYYDYGFGGEDDDSHKCTSFKLEDGSVLKEDCSLKYFSVCKSKAWRDNITMFRGNNYALSNAKLRYTDAVQLCKEKGNQLGVKGRLLTISTDTESNFVKRIIKKTKDFENTGNNVKYFINRGSGRRKYSNWAKPPTSQNAVECIVISDTKDAGKWQSHSCYDYENFICKWPKVKSDTKETVETPTTFVSLEVPTTPVAQEVPTTLLDGRDDQAKQTTGATTKPSVEVEVNEVVETTTIQQGANINITTDNTNIAATEGRIESTTGAGDALRQEMMTTTLLSLAGVMFTLVTLD